jgi:DNA modification methylase
MTAALLETSGASEMPEDHRRALELYYSMPVADAAARLGWSRGKLNRLVGTYNAYKTREHRERRAQEEARERRENLQEILNTTVTLDALDFLRSLPDSSVALTLTSIPYNVGIGYGSGRARADKMATLAYHGWLKIVISELSRVMMPGRAIVIQMGSTTDDDGHTIPLDKMLFDDFRAAGFDFNSRIWWPTHAGLYPHKRLAPRCETALLMVKRARDVGGMRAIKPTLPTVFNLTPARTPQRNPTKRGFRVGAENYGDLTGHPHGATPTDRWDDVKHIGHNHPEKAASAGHPAIFSEGFATRATLLLTNPGDLILDPFIGSGTTAVVARRTSRAFVGADLYYEDTRAQRLAAIEPDLVCPFPGVTDESLAIWEAEAKRISHAAEPASPELEEQLHFELDVKAVQLIP